MFHVTWIVFASICLSVLSFLNLLGRAAPVDLVW